MQPDVAPLTDQRLPADLDFDRTCDGLAGLFTDAGIVDVVATELTWTWQVLVDDLWAGIRAGVATPGMTYLAQTAPVRARMAAHFRERASSMAENDILTFTARAVMAVGRTP